MPENPTSTKETREGKVSFDKMLIGSYTNRAITITQLSTGFCRIFATDLLVFGSSSRVVVARTIGLDRSSITILCHQVCIQDREHTF